MIYVNAMNITLTEQEVEDNSLGTISDPYRVYWQASIDCAVMEPKGGRYRSSFMISMERRGDTAQAAYIKLVEALRDEGITVQ